MPFEYYVGPQSWPLAIRKRLPFAREFSSCGRFHDIAYGRGGKEKDRLRADRLFFKLMLARTRSMRIIERVPATFVATAYFVAVLTLGWLHFDYHA